MIHNKIITFGNGDRITYNEVFREYHARLRFYALKITQNEEEAKDIAAHCFAKLLQIEMLFNDLSHLQNYLRKMFYSTSMDYLRKRKTRNDYNAENNAEPIASKQFIEWQYEKSDIIKMVFSTLQQYPSTQRKIFMLRYFKGYSNQEIASMLNISEQTVRNQLSNVLKRLRIDLNENDFLMLLCLIGQYFSNN